METVRLIFHILVVCGGAFISGVLLTYVLFYFICPPIVRWRGTLQHPRVSASPAQYQAFLKAWKIDAGVLLILFCVGAVGFWLGLPLPPGPVFGLDFWRLMSHTLGSMLSGLLLLGRAWRTMDAVLKLPTFE